MRVSLLLAFLPGTMAHSAERGRVGHRMTHAQVVLADHGLTAEGWFGRPFGYP